mgnify:CR=1 FL=1
MRMRWQFLLFFSAIFLAACGSLEAITPAPPTATSTPISTELPPIATAIPAGFNEENPIQIVIVPADPDSAEDHVEAFEDALNELTDVEITVVLVETQTEAYTAVCSAASGTVSAAWVNGMTYAATSLNRCGTAGLRADTPDGTGQTGVLLLNMEYEDNGIDDAIEETLCRISVDDFFSWILPVLFYGAEDFTLADIVEIDELDDNDEILESLMDNDCAAAGMSEAAWEAYLDAESDSEEEIDEEDTLEANIFVAATSPEIPYNVFSFSGAMTLDALQDIQSALLELDEESGRSEIDPESTDELSPDAEMMVALFGYGSFEAVDDGDMQELLDFMQDSGINFAGLAD